MRLFFKVFVAIALPLVVLASLLILGPKETVGAVPRFDSAVLTPDIDAYLVAQEARFDDIVPGVQKQIIWHDETKSKTPYALVYLHGFSASLQEIRPVPDRIAQKLEANLYFTRLKGHGRAGAAMGDVVADDWLKDLAQAVAIGRTLGDKVILIGTSTGGTLAALAALDAELSQHLAAVIFVAPNFAVQAKQAELLTLPFARIWGPWIAGATQQSPQLNPKATKYWTTSFPTQAIVPLMVLVRHVQQLDFSKADVPALFYFSTKDKTVRPQATQKVAEQWGGKTNIVHPKLTINDDPGAHVIAGYLRSPHQTETAIKVMANWLASIGIVGEP